MPTPHTDTLFFSFANDVSVRAVGVIFLSLGTASARKAGRADFEVWEMDCICSGNGRRVNAVIGKKEEDIEDLPLTRIVVHTNATYVKKSPGCVKRGELSSRPVPYTHTRE